MGVLSSVGAVTPTRPKRPNSSGRGHSHSPCAFYLQWEWSLPKGVAKPTRHGRSIFTGSGHSHSPWAFDFEWEWPLPRAMGVLYSVGVITPSLNDSIIYVLDASYIPRQIRWRTMLHEKTSWNSILPAIQTKRKNERRNFFNEFLFASENQKSTQNSLVGLAAPIYIYIYVL